MMKKSTKRTKKSSKNVGILELLAFVFWLALAGGAGYWFGLPPDLDCAVADPPPVAVQQAAPKPKCIPRTVNANAPPAPPKHSTLDRLKKQWQCARADLNASHEKVLRAEDNSLIRTKWNSIMSFSPKPFFDRYLSQYPIDTISHQPVVVFSHKPLTSFNDLSTSCRVMDIAVVPDEDDVCVAVTETFHDVASYHMLHAERRAMDGKFVWRPNNVASRNVPTEENYFQ